MKRVRSRQRTSLPTAKPYCFFAHVAFALDARAHANPEATTNLLIEISDTTLTSDGKRKRLKVSAQKSFQKLELASEIAMAAALDYLKSEPELRQFPAQRFVNFDLIRAQTYISIRPPPTKILPNGSKVWRLSQSQADKLRS